MDKNARTKMAFNSRMMPPPQQYVAHYDPMFFDQPHNVSKQLFWRDSASGDKMYPRYPPVPEVQKEVIKRYVCVHNIQESEMLDFWMDYVDCLIACHEFEEKAPQDFKAWAYGRLCRYVLLSRPRLRVSSTMTTTTMMQAGAYDPVDNYRVAPLQ